MRNNRIAKLFIIVNVLIGSCVRQDGDSGRDNPFDAGGSNWKINSTPAIAALDSQPLWYDFDFRDSGGTIRAAVHAKDNNEPNDSLAVSALFGTSATGMDTAVILFDSIVKFDGCRTAATYYYQIRATDTWDSVGIKNGHFVTPSGMPPRLSDSVFITGGYNYITLEWYTGAANTRYRVYRSNSRGGPFKPFVDTTIAQAHDLVTCQDRHPMEPLTYYILAGVNQFGECKAKTELCGYLYNSSVSVPSSVSASSGEYTNHIRISWYKESYAGTYSYFIHKSAKSSGPYRIIDSTTSLFYIDSIRDTASSASSVYYYYKVSARDSHGRMSAPSSYACGSTAALFAPSNVTASQGIYDRYIAVSWYPVSGASEYAVYRSISSYGTYERIGKTGSTAYKDSVQSGDTYYYKVSAATSYGKNGPLSSYASGYIRPLPVPTNISISKGSFADHILLTWSPVPGATGYFIFRAKIGLSDSVAIFDTTNNTVYRDSVKTTEDYYYALMAFDGIGRQSTKTPVSQGYITRLDAPTGTKASGEYYDYILIEWQKVAGASGYYVYRSEKYEGPYAHIGSSVSESYKDTAVDGNGATAAGKTYYYKIAAHAAVGMAGTLTIPLLGSVRPFSYPANIKASNYEYKNRIALTWDSVAKASGYAVYRSDYPSYGFMKIGNAKTTGYIDTSIGTAPCVYYKISTLKGAVESSISSAVMGYRLIPPGTISVKGYSEYIAIIWNGFSHSAIRGYHIYRSTDSVTFIRIAVINGNATASYRDSFPGYTRCYYRLSAFSSSDESEQSGSYGAKKIPSQPKHLTARASATGIELTWDSVAGAENYKVYRGLTPSSTSPIGSPVLPKFVDTPPATSATRYYYYVSAVNSSGESPKSDSVHAGLLKPPAVPGSLTASGSAAAITVSWRVEDGIIGCVVYRSNDSGKVFAVRDTVPGTGPVPCTYFYLDTVTNGIMYHYKVAAYNQSGTSPQTGAVMARRNAPAMPPSLTTGGAHYTTHIQLSWGESPGASGYNLYRSLSPDSAYTKRAAPAGTIFRDSTVQVNTVYYYKISAFNCIGESPLSGYVAGIRIP